MSAWRIPQDDGLVQARPGYRMSAALADAGPTQLGGGHMRFDEDADLGAWVLTYDEVIVVLDGQLSVDVDGTSLTAGPGESLLLAAGATVRYRAEAGMRGVYVITPPRAVPERA